MEKKICSKCGVEKDICNFHKDKTKKCGYKSQCNSCIHLRAKIYKKENAVILAEKRKKYYEENKDLHNIISKNYRQKNREKLRIKQKEKYQNNSIFKLKVNVRRRINKVLHNKTISSFEIVGCSTNELKIYLEERFENRMTWENYGKFGWHIDHIIPLDSGTTEEEIIKLCHYTNLQPLWCNDNWSKGKKIPENTVFNETL
jgi:hypothetical protein